ncbi:MAG TPA: hypothetical protein VGQ38_01240 [Gaiellaceae bacterium]|nr:hypothetical protein [Gaiellaceae bacterium]
MWAAYAVALSAEDFCCGGNDLVMWDVPNVLADVPSVTEGILDLTVPVAPKHVLDRLADTCPCGDGPREHGISVSDFERENNGRTANRRRSKHAHLRELVGEMQNGVVDP